MSLLPWTVGGSRYGYDDPFFSGIERAMDRAFSRAYDPSASGGTGVLVPNLFRTVAGGTPMDINENDTEYTISADAPGFSPSEVSVEEHDGVLTVRGAKEEKKENRDKSGNILRQERSYRSFSRSFTLPDNVDANKIGASLEHGVLNVHVPKLQSAKKVTEPRRITVGTSAARADTPAAVQEGGPSANAP